MIPWLSATSPFPPVSSALTKDDDAPGLLAAGADLSPGRLLDAYRRGIFPWYADGQPILWWSTDPRMVLYTNAFRISHSLQKTLRRIHRSEQAGGEWRIRFDTAFENVMRACAVPREHGGGTWISEDIVTGYGELHRQGYAHSVELWNNGMLVAGVYGVCIGRMFYGESMFTRVSDGSKVALAYLVRFLQSNKVEMIDCQQETSHLASLGGVAIPRDDFLAHLRVAIRQEPIARWEPIPLF